MRAEQRIEIDGAAFVARELTLGQLLELQGMDNGARGEEILRRSIFDEFGAPAGEAALELGHRDGQRLMDAALAVNGWLGDDLGNAP